MKTIKIFGGDMGRETILVRCNLSEATSPVQIDYCEGIGWQSTQYQCANTCHRKSGLVDLGVELAADAMEVPLDEFECKWEEV